MESFRTYTGPRTAYGPSTPSTSAVRPTRPAATKQRNRRGRASSGVPVDHRRRAAAAAAMSAFAAAILILLAGSRGGTAAAPVWNGAPSISVVSSPPVAPPEATPTPAPSPAASTAPTWDRCVPITWYLRRGEGPPNAYDLAREAIATVSAASGLVFEYGGETSSPELPEAANIREPVLTVAWATSAEKPTLEGEVAGVGSAQWQEGGTVPRFISGLAVVDSGSDLPADARTTNSQGAILLHELGHALGLDHRDEAGSIMRPRLEYSESPPRFAPEDVAALRGLVDDSRC